MSLLLDLLPAFHGKRILVLGDLILDEYILGRPTRLSREAPIPVLEFSRRVVLPGGGTAPACNIQSLGGQAVQIGVVGADRAGEELRQTLESSGVETTGLVVDASRPTILKSRIMSQGPQRLPQQVARIDTLDRRPIDEAVERDLIAVLERELPRADALLMSDYQSGTVSPSVVSAALALARRLGTLTTVDAQGEFAKFRGVSVFRCNDREAEAALHATLHTEAEFAAALPRLRAEVGTQGVVVTRGPAGMSVLDSADTYHYIPVSNNTEVYDVTGAGDTVIAVLTLALTAGAGLYAAARLANYGAGIVVQKVGNVPLRPDELRARLQSAED